MDIEQVARDIENDGLSYTLQYGISGEHIEDPVLRGLCIKAKTVLNEIENYLEEKYWSTLEE